MSGTIGVSPNMRSGIIGDAVTEIADDAIDSEHYAAASIDTAHIGNLQVTTALIAADAITTAKIADSPTLVTPNLGTPSAVTLTNATFPASHVTKVHVIPAPADVATSGAGTITYQTVVISPSSGTSKLYAFHTLHHSQGDGGTASFQQQLTISGSNVTNRTDLTSEVYSRAPYNFHVRSWLYKEVLLDGSASDVTFLFQVVHGHQNNSTYVIGNNGSESSVTIIEVY